jgi:hypothetical protein
LHPLGNTLHPLGNTLHPLGNTLLKESNNMQIFQKAAVLSALLVASTWVTTVGAKQDVQALPEDEGYWTRFVMDVADSFPSSPPTPEPVCLVEVST